MLRGSDGGLIGFETMIGYVARHVSGGLPVGRPVVKFGLGCDECKQKQYRRFEAAPVGPHEPMDPGLLVYASCDVLMTRWVLVALFGADFFGWS